MVDFAYRFNQHIFILAGVFESVEGLTDFVVYILVSWGKLVAEQVEDGKIYLIGSVRVGGMNFRLNVSRIIEQNIEDGKPKASVAFCIMALVFVSANNFGIDGNMVGHQSVGDDSFFESEVFRRMACINGMDLGLEFLSVTAGMNCLTDIILTLVN